MYDWAKEQQKEIATIKERTIHLNLSDADCKRISTYAAKANITVSQLLESFIGDLVMELIQMEVMKEIVLKNGLNAVVMA